MTTMTADPEQQQLEDRYRLAMRRLGFRLILILSISAVAQLASERLLG